MKTKFSSILTLLLVLVVQITFAQERTITGTVVDEDGLPLPGVTVLIKGTNTGTQTDFDGNYSITASQGDVLVYSFIGMQTSEYTVGNNDTIDVTLTTDSSQLDEVVVTALGIEREKKSLGYATQEVDGSEVSDVPTQNFVNSLSGKVAGLKVSSTGTLGGSSNVVIRGNSSLTGNNQALFVIDGTPVSNANNNRSGQDSGRGGYDYGNAASDINPNDIASINILKGAAATALYGARAANGAVIIETKKGRKGKGIGVSVSSTLMTTHVNDNTLPEYQDQYGAGYGAYYQSEDGYFNLSDIDGDGNPDLTTPFTEDASFGGRFDGRPVYQWNSIYPQLEGTDYDFYQQATPWEAGEHTPNDIWETGYTAINSIALDGGTDKSSFRLSATNFNQQGNLPNSRIKRNTLKFSGQHEFTDKFSAQANISYTKTDGKGRYGTGYSSGNLMQQFRQWWQTNVDLYDQRDAYFATRENITWNPNGPDNLSPIYSDNPYWTLYENYQTDTRNRYFGNINLNYEISDVFSVLGRFSFDTFDELQEERINVGSADIASYSRFNNRAAEYNYDLILNFNKDVTEDLNLDGNIGFNLRRNESNYILAETNGGLNAPGFYALSNSASPMNPPEEYESDRMLDGIYARAGLGYLDTYFLEGTIRRDRSSTLPKENNTFYYPSISTSVILSNVIDANWLSFAKLRANYAEVGNDTDPYRVFNTYEISAPFGSAGWASNNSQLANLALDPERMKSYEIGLEANFFDRRVGFDVSYYNSQTENQITPVPVSTATGFQTKLLNAGTIENKGIEASVTLNPIRTEDFNWTMNINWAKNRSEVLELTDGIDNLQLNPVSLQGGVSINAAPGQPYGAIRGTAYVYDDNGNRVITDAGYYERTPNANYIIGNIQPDWTGGVSNSISYKNLTLSFLVDVQKGGDVFSLDTWYGRATGIYASSVGTNDLGNPMRNTIANGGGVILDGVQGDVSYNDDGTYEVTNTSPNTTRARTDYFGNPYGYGRDANEGHVYDASFVKLREASLTYNFGSNIIDATPFTNASLSIIGRNLWIIHKNMPYSDPEAGLSSGNVQGYQSGAYPAVREIGASLKFNF
ncbi:MULTISPECIES: SusC/RagA family TonB-linked outer membrane protein [Salegentibacter]|uniref:SusC/RagA family TonB-linked outer membrane protein n=1 Tax=Salegentibacter maritimus TaxID=2794347 RepID=A0ABS0TCF5_9FLAO|nr:MULTISPECIES: SusC/RagA family TonB-linked outer membrane protein [Salegentibacter]MBE7639642.1 SusC/RagA family TonB-linked outer membrane protein [Salegentibacter sp. BLCTC]MBI6115584.1 SusC/RagA family TonB-linked outer membrane protein [Salegentibacter maritimus]MBI6118723.1 SusC/RagA family TonB-linked outer membrane protein [Salegentibacter maritimus]